jgi:soluble lytic murein transglycosylase-like protein
LAVLAPLLLASAALAGGTYRFEDADGVVHFTNVPGDPRYRFVRRDPEPREDSPARPGSGAGALGRGLRPFAQLIRTAAERHGVDSRLVEAVVQVESAGNPIAVSPKGAQGLMQLMPERAAALGVRDPFDPGQNVDGGVRHLRDLLQRFRGDVTLALAAYNAGEAAVRAHGGVPPYAETREYVQRVRAVYEGAGLLVARSVAPVTAPQRVYREVAADGTLIFTNLPPRPGPARRGSGTDRL